MKMNFKIYTFIIACLLLSLNSLAETNSFVTDYQNQLDEITLQYESQWDILCETAENIPATIEDGEEKHILLEKLLLRINDENDSLNDLKDYELVVSNPGFSYLLYAKAYGMMYNEDDDRAANVFKLLVSTNNLNGFALGNSHYWLGRYFYFIKKDKAAALKHYLLVHSLPSCLVYTDASYCCAARIYNDIGKPETALALYSVQIPHIDYWWKELEKAERSFYIAFLYDDITNAVRQIERANRALKQVPAGIDSYKTSRWRLQLENSSVFTNLSYAAISNNVMNNYSPYNYEIDCLRTAFNGNEKVKDDPILEDMLLHAWPMRSDVDALILTNRVLSNNVFEQKRRTDVN